jgi:hypothetical protein
MNSRFIATINCKQLELDVLFISNLIATLAVVIPKLPFMNRAHSGEDKNQ